MKVHNTLGNGFQEVIYQRCLAIELKRAGISFEREKEHDIFYENIHVGTRRADFVVENLVIVELKALISLEDVHLAQAKNYVVAYDKPIGLLINFGARSLQIKKVFNSKYQDQDLQDSRMSRMDRRNHQDQDLQDLRMSRMDRTDAAPKAENPESKQP